MDVYYLPLTNMRIARTFCFTNNGQALYLVSPTEIQRLTYSQETCENLQVNHKNMTIISSEVKYFLRSLVLSIPYTPRSVQLSLHEKIHSLYWDFQSTCFGIDDKVYSSLSCSKRDSHLIDPVFFSPVMAKKHELLYTFCTQSPHRLNTYYIQKSPF